MKPVGLVTGSEPFAQLPDSPSSALLPYIDGRDFGGITVKTAATPVSLAGLPQYLPALIAEHRPAFVVSLGLALGEPVLRVETMAINKVNFAISDNEGARPTSGTPLIPDGPTARRATWNDTEIVDALLDADLPARISHFAGTHMCNATLYTTLSALEALGLDSPCGFFHLPYLPEQIARFLRESPADGDFAPRRERVLASMSFANQLSAVEIMLSQVAAQASGGH